MGLLQRQMWTDRKIKHHQLDSGIQNISTQCPSYILSCNIVCLIISEKRVTNISNKSVKDCNNYIYHDFAVIQWITLCHKNQRTCVIKLWCIHVTSLTMFMSAMRSCQQCVLFILKVTKFHFKGSYDKSNSTFMVL